TIREDDNDVEEPWVSPAYFSAMEIPVLAGRAFTEQDQLGKAKVAVINLTAAKKFFGNPQNAIGRVIAFAGAQSKLDGEIVGVVGDPKPPSVRDPSTPTAYRALLQNPQLNSVTYLLRTSQNPKDAEAGIRSAMQQLDSKLAISNLQTKDEQI